MKCMIEDSWNIQSHPTGTDVPQKKLDTISKELHLSRSWTSEWQNKQIQPLTSVGVLISISPQCQKYLKKINLMEERLILAQGFQSYSLWSVGFIVSAPNELLTLIMLGLPKFPTPANIPLSYGTFCECESSHAPIPPRQGL